MARDTRFLRRVRLLRRRLKLSERLCRSVGRYVSERNKLFPFIFKKRQMFVHSIDDRIWNQAGSNITDYFCRGNAISSESFSCRQHIQTSFFHMIGKTTEPSSGLSMLKVNIFLACTALIIPTTLAIIRPSYTLHSTLQKKLCIYFSYTFPQTPENKQNQLCISTCLLSHDNYHSLS